ncbi:helix-turn-helix protein [mine drainage metagenome]|uniref:Helix-turn-helix protein n=1 Tax=mine drainage metagenome TaxID=410659 RepID=A0A1J5SKL6_9ZZZZ
MSSSLHSHHYHIFRNLLVSAREKSGLTQVQIADQLGKPQSFISKYERGERRLDFTEFIELAEVLGIDVVDFMNHYQTAITEITIQKTYRVKKSN